MSASIPHYKSGPASKQVATLIYGGQLVQPNTQSYATTDLTIKLATANTVYCIGVAGADGNVLSAQTGAPNSYGQPLIDISVLTDYIPVIYGGYDTWAWYSGQAYEGQRLLCAANGTVTGAGAGPAADQVVGICTHPGGVASAMLTQAIGGQGSTIYFFGRMRVF
jgi:hypothetical protein